MKTKPWMRLKLLSQWRRVVFEAARIIKDTYPQAEIYLLGGAAEDRLTIYSDIDLGIVFPENINREKRIEILEKIWEKLEDKIPAYYPLHIIILNREELKRLKGSKKRIK